MEDLNMFDEDEEGAGYDLFASGNKDHNAPVSETESISIS